ncbi:hypothetical protein [Xenorhabdus sp. Sc-CR9]|uniref:hypothetical protein n=1 Tax=Xenorhabdus sp. Sc-CR9 TaxID=2584468 RepID=UPI001F2A6EF9|nr:hypothetical protein [Xenorhabdus sp. Sc-CR9]
MLAGKLSVVLGNVALRGLIIVGLASEYHFIAIVSCYSDCLADTGKNAIGVGIPKCIRDT